MKNETTTMTKEQTARALYKAARNENTILNDIEIRDVKPCFMIDNAPAFEVWYSIRGCSCLGMIKILA